MIISQYYPFFATQVTLEVVKVVEKLLLLFFQHFSTTAPPGDFFFIFPKMKPKINIIDLRLLERPLSAAVVTVIKIASFYIIFDENVERVSAKSVTVYLGKERESTKACANSIYGNHDFSPLAHAWDLLYV